MVSAELGAGVPQLADGIRRRAENKVCCLLDNSNIFQSRGNEHALQCQKN